jgi:hypothetical protein
VHFTILRTPQKDDFTPVRELSLIVFPMRELFEQKLKEFDLIIFDRYESGNLITRDYFRNITEYVKGGGALLVSVGPQPATQRSLYRTPLGAICRQVPLGDSPSSPRSMTSDSAIRSRRTCRRPATRQGTEAAGSASSPAVTSAATPTFQALTTAAGDPRPCRRGPRGPADVRSPVAVETASTAADRAGTGPACRALADEGARLEEEVLGTAVGGRIEVTRRTLPRPSRRSR